MVMEIGSQCRMYLVWKLWTFYFYKVVQTCHLKQILVILLQLDNPKYKPPSMLIETCSLKPRADVVWKTGFYRWLVVWTPNYLSSWFRTSYWTVVTPLRQQTGCLGAIKTTKKVSSKAAWWLSISDAAF